MAKNEKTGKSAASAAGKTLESKSASKAAAGSTLAQTKSNKVTGSKAASNAGKTLGSKSASKAAKSAAASALTQKSPGRAARSKR